MTDQTETDNQRDAISDARAQLDATREVLHVISMSRDDEQPVFEKISQAVARLCDASLAYVSVVNAARTHVSIPAQFGARPEFAERLARFNVPVQEDWIMAVDAALNRRVISIEDLSQDPLYKEGNEYRVSMVDEEGMRSVLVVPLEKGAQGMGCIFLYRREVRPFTEDEVAVVRNFAVQAVIVIENVRQFREVQERLARERASSEILGVISESRKDQDPVFEAILRNACRLCDAPLAGLILGTAQDEAQTLAAHVGMFPEAIDLFDSGQMKMDPNLSYAARSIVEGRLIAFDDMGKSELYDAGSPVVRSMVDASNIRSVIFVPLMQDGAAIGNLTLFRSDVQPFDQGDIDLIETFASQAVIAIENVRQFREIQTRLERERGMAEVLSLISTSRDDEAPVFDMILKKAADLCSADAAALALGRKGDTHQTMPASYGLAQETQDMYDTGQVPMDPATSVGAQAILGGKPVHVRDMSDTEQYRGGVSIFQSVVQHTGIRTNLLVPLLTPAGGIGVLILFRKVVKPFTPDEIALVESFAAQAVIAIENVRQFKALETLNAELGARVEEQVGEIERMGRLKRFLPAAVADSVVSQGNEAVLESHRALLGVLFCDIRGFTAFCETAEPEETIEVLQSYHEEMGKLIAEHGAGVDTRAGDGIMVLFNDPLPCDDPAGDALRLGLAMRARMAELSRTWRRHGHRLGFGVGISLGYATVGMVGSAGRFDYTASGTAVNLAARLCDQAKDGEILLSPRAYTAVEDDFAAETVGELTLKGIHAPVEVFRVVTEA